MSLGIVIKAAEGIVFGADSRVTLEAKTADNRLLPVTFDNATKLLTLNPPHNFFAAVTYGAAVIGLRTAHSFLPEFELTLKDEAKRLEVLDYARRLSDFFMKQWSQGMPPNYPGPAMTFLVGGYDPEAAYGKVFLFDVPKNPVPQPRNPGEREFGMSWGGQLEVTSRLIHGYDPSLPAILKQTLNLNDEQVTSALQALQKALEFKLPYDVLPLQDCIDLATFLIRTTITAQALSIGLRGVGGPIEVATITRIDGVKYIQRKTLHGERQNTTA